MFSFSFWTYYCLVLCISDFQPSPKNVQKMSPNYFNILIVLTYLILNQCDNIFFSKLTADTKINFEFYNICQFFPFFPFKIRVLKLLSPKTRTNPRGKNESLIMYLRRHRLFHSEGVTILKHTILMNLNYVVRRYIWKQKIVKSV